MMKRIKLSRYNIERDGTLRTLELYGPNRLGTWLQSYNVLLAVLVMIDAVWWTLDTFKRTGRTLRVCQRDMVPKSGLSSIKQMSAADMERLKRSLKVEHDAATAAGKTTDYDDKRPWNLVWARAVTDEALWREEVNEPCMLILTKITSATEVVEGDAKVATAPASSSNQHETAPAPARMTSE